MELIKTELVPCVDLPECPECGEAMKPKNGYEIKARVVEKPFLKFFTTKKIEHDVYKEFECIKCNHKESYPEWAAYGSIYYSVKGRFNDEC